MGLGLCCAKDPLRDADALNAVRTDLLRIMCAPEWDDGSYAPLLIRLAWHSSGTYCKADGTGGSNGAPVRYPLESGDPENAGLGRARALLEPVRELHPWLSTADLRILAAYVAIESTGGPRIEFTGGRADARASGAGKPGRPPGAEKGLGLTRGSKVDAQGRMQGWEGMAQHVRDVFGRMGFGDREAVALLCGGHVYGRCHPENSGYNGARVVNPTCFSNGYAAGLIGDRWIAVEHDSRMPDGGSVPEEVRPARGKRQYVNLSKYEGGEQGGQKVARAPKVTSCPPGRYKCVSSWVNCRELANTSSSIIGRLVREEEVNLVVVRSFATSVRGLAERGGWVSVIASGGKALFERQGDLDLKAMQGRYRAAHGAGAPIFKELGAAAGSAKVKAGDEFCVGQVVLGREGDKAGRLAEAGALLGRRSDPGAGCGEWVLLFSPTLGLVSELIVQGYNEKPRRALKGQLGHQMMLVSDMVLLWDESFKKVLQEYAEDEELLRRDFGDAFRRLTELGCPWSQDAPQPHGQAEGEDAGGRGAIGCPYLAAKGAET